SAKAGDQYAAAVGRADAQQRRPLEYWDRPVKPGDDNSTFFSIIRPQIIRDAVGLVEVVPVIGIAVQQRAGLRLVIRRDVVGLIERLREDVAIILVVRLRADEDADAVVWLGIEVANIV